jgi:predicted DNA repair protein MutK
MPAALSINDFIPFGLTCELRYRNAYLLFDQTGKILEDLREHFPGLEVTSAFYLL